MSGTATENPSPARPRRWVLTLLKAVVITTSGLVVAGVAAAMVISHTTAGREFALARALEWLRPSLDGTLRVGSMGPGGLLAGATLYDVVLSDSLGRPVLVADSVRARYSVAEIFGGPPAIADLHVWSPVVHLEPEPGQKVTLSGLFAGTGMEADGDNAATLPHETGSPLFRIRGASIHGGTVIKRDASGAEERVEGIEADFARVDIGPGHGVDLAAVMDEVALSYPIGPGARLELSGLRGEVEVRKDDILVRAERFRLPGSEGSGRMLVDMSDELWLTVFDLGLSRLSLTDLAWLDERLDHGVARGGVRIAIGGNAVRVDASEAEVETNSGTFAISGGVSFADAVRFRDLRVRPRMLATAEIERWLPDTPPLAGAVSGDIRFDGVPGRLHVSGEVTLFDGNTLETRVHATGRGTVLGVRSFEGMKIEAMEFDYALLDFFAPGVSWGGRGDLRSSGRRRSGHRHDREGRGEPLRGRRTSQHGHGGGDRVRRYVNLGSRGRRHLEPAVIVDDPPALAGLPADGPGNRFGVGKRLPGTARLCRGTGDARRSAVGKGPDQRTRPGRRISNNRLGRGLPSHTAVRRTAGFHSRIGEGARERTGPGPRVRTRRPGHNRRSLERRRTRRGHGGGERMG